jgi:Tol biopolymer transport system component
VWILLRCGIRQRDVRLPLSPPANGPQQIYRANEDGTNIRRLYQRWRRSGESSRSPDGTFLAFAWKKPGNSRFEIFLHDLVTGNNTQLTQSCGGQRKTTWSPEWKHIAFESIGLESCRFIRCLRMGSKSTAVDASGIKKAPAWSATSNNHWRSMNETITTWHSTVLLLVF